MSKGFAHILLLIIGVVIAGVLITRNSVSFVKINETPVPTESATSIPTISPTSKPTTKPKSTIVATPTPKLTTVTTSVPQSACDKFKPADGLTTITLNLQASSGQIVGDTIVKIKPASSCPGTLPSGWGGELTEVIRQGTTSWTSPGMSPGNFRVDVNYHNSGQGFDVEGTSGNHPVTVTLNN